MPYQVSRSGPQTLNIALNLEHWDKFSWKNRFPSGILSPKSVNRIPHLWIDELERTPVARQMRKSTSDGESERVTLSFRFRTRFYRPASCST
ncbi:cytochrome P450 monooxygenase (Fum15) [Ktedonobacter racemifer DSM 44963]|uniref:Cytochrome P450 monooxygenase (Fum15) n=1 Tax=Ktedonobacter racemifer DSM 44963 TaxID=485913 RepID=D6U3X3_KTERA|nr:cytochrome P450 monooxygenase (Fum15) [Ktedonobacter racemifer DSM 44963]